MLWKIGPPRGPLRNVKLKVTGEAKGAREAECSAEERRGVSRKTKFQKSEVTEIKGDVA